MTGASILVTGATGFIGHQLCRTLVESGKRVRGLVRGPVTLPPGVEPAECTDLLDRDAIRSALQGVNAVVHLAARVHVMADRSADPLTEYRRTNVEGTRILLEESLAAGVRKLVLLSSVKAVGEATAVAWNEETPPAPTDPYGISKLEAERLVHELTAHSALAACVLRLPLVYGPGVRANMLRLFQLVDRGVPLPLGRVHNRRSLAYVGNVVAAIEAVMASPAAAGHTFFVSDSRALSTPDLIRAIARALGRPARLLPVPEGFLRAARLVPAGRAAADRLLGSLVVDSSKLTRITGFSPPYDVERGLRLTARWYRERSAGRR
ncbi:MAG: NAD-dependent epimerase/dehydratase family protein [Gemmatimonadales bacterium]|nr:NAD-dependent epimerase/dehydratase family protein [Gemmatimonadales bacterium]